MSKKHLLFRSVVSAAILAMTLPMHVEAAIDGAFVLRGGASAAQPVEEGREITNDGSGWMEVAFVNGASLLLGPGARVRIDRVERDANGAVVRIDARVEGGSVRASLPSGMTAALLVPGGTAVLQGGAALLQVGGQQTIATLLTPGELTLDGAGGNVVIRRPGFSSTMAIGAAPGTIARQDREQLERVVAALTPARRGQEPGLVPVGAAVQDAVQLPTSETGERVEDARQRGRDGERPNFRTPNSNGGVGGGQRFAFTLAGSILPGGVAGTAIAQTVANPPTPNQGTPMFFANSALTDRVPIADSTKIEALTASDGSRGRLRRMQAISETGLYGGAPFYSAPNFVRADGQIERITTGDSVTPNYASYGAFTDATVGLFTQILVKRESISAELLNPTRYLYITDNQTSVQVYRGRFDENFTVRSFAPPRFFEIPLSQDVGFNPVVTTSYVDGLRLLDVDGTIYGSFVERRVQDAPTQANPFPQERVGLLILDVAAQRDTRGINAGDRFFLISGEGLTATHDAAPTSQVLPATPGTVWRYAISDGINHLAGFNGSQSVDQNFVSDPGITAFTRFSGLRAEDTYVPSVTRGDTHLLVVAGDPASRNSANPANPTTAFRIDLQIEAPSGGAAGGRSSASVSVGGIAPLSATNPALALSGSTVGSVRLSPGGSLAILSGFGSLGTDQTGTGAHMFAGSSFAGDQTATDTQADRDARLGRLGYFAIGEADPRRGAPTSPAYYEAGTLSPAVPSALMAEYPQTSFGFTRLATGIATVAGSRTSGVLEGFAAGLAEQVVASPSGPALQVVALTTRSSSDLKIEIDSSRTELQEAVFRLAQAEAGSIGREVAATLQFGGRDPVTQMPRSAFANDTTFAALGNTPGSSGARPGIAMASVNGDIVRGIPQIVLPDGTTDAFPASNQHVQWGLFLGDVANTATLRGHVGMGFWVAGRPVVDEQLRTVTGTATYAGGMIGNVVDNKGIRTAVGGFNHNWNFASRTGQFSANFDGATWGGSSTVATSMPTPGNVFAGAGSNGSRTLSLQGGFFHNPSVPGAGGVGPGNPPAATGGQFAVQGTNYGANGIFVGNRR